MDTAFFERLLFEEESTTLDFKKEQYRFVKATDDEKSELLKDILGFTNAFRRSEAYVLIGVEDVRGGPSKVLGIADKYHLDDHSLQQFVNNLTNKPVRFQYEAFGYDDKQVGIIRIEEKQLCPIYLKYDYGKLQKEKVYVRRGSSTDPTKPASIEEIALMGQGSAQHPAELVIEFADVKRDDSLGPHISWDAEFCEMPPLETIPDLKVKRNHDAFRGINIDGPRRLNENYYRELTIFEFVRRLYRPVRLVVNNVGQVSANNVRVELTIPTNAGVVALDSSKMPHPPKRRPSFNDMLKNIRPAFRRTPGEVDIDNNDDRFRIEIDCGDLQPGRRVWSDVFYMGIGATGDHAIPGQIFAENLPQPKDFSLTLSVIVTRTKLEISDLRSLPEPKREKKLS
jgi:hypothetical protein